MTVEKPNYYIWECACGEGHLSKRLKQKGFFVISSDLIYRWPAVTFLADFLQLNEAPGFNEIDKFDILTNPPYKYAKEFVLKALELLPEGCKSYMFLKLTFLEGKARFKEIFSKTPPKKVYVVRDRIQCAKNAEFETMRKNGGSAIAYAWFVWEKGFTGETTLDWI